MKFYLAGNYSRRAELTEVAEILHRHGHYVTSRWLLGDHEASYEHVERGGATVAQFADEDFEDVLSSDVLVHFSKAKDHGGRDRGGRHVEFGVAIATPYIQPVHVGPVENVFHSLHIVRRFESTEAFIDSVVRKQWLPSDKGCKLTLEECIRKRTP